MIRKSRDVLVHVFGTVSYNSAALFCECNLCYAMLCYAECNVSYAICCHSPLSLFTHGGFSIN